MSIALLFSLLMAAQAPPAKPPAPAPTAPPAKTAPAQPAQPAQPRTTPRRTTPAPTGGLAVTATDGKGTPFADVTVELSGSKSDTRKTDAAGQVSFPSLSPGTYRLRFTGNEITTFEREVTLTSGVIAKLPITLSPAPPPPVAAAPAPAPAPPPPAPVVGPAGEPQLGSLAKLADRERNAKERREVLLSCSGNTRNVLLVLTDEQPQRIYDNAESTYYVISGQGAAIVGKLQSVITTGSFITIPRGTPFTLARQGNRPLAMLWTLSGEPCESAK